MITYEKFCQNKIQNGPLTVILNCFFSFSRGGTGMIASGSIFCSHLGRVIRDLFRPLYAVYGIVRKH